MKIYYLGDYVGDVTSTHIAHQNSQESVAVASIARDDPSTLPGDDPFILARTHCDRNAVNWDRNLKPKQEAFEKCWAHSPQQADSRQFTRCR